MYLYKTVTIYTTTLKTHSNEWADYEKDDTKIVG